ncbi:hypothetical protein A8C32_13680 [Flavivirga aquatica]|uniref:Anti-sigma factor n=1 Tax=Flavivirga aquatica TaxID=1849968 RepID=A0A1E5TC57_9FLAO|nr:FecR family protein [Flavivirga aquatica]OEK08955.1 hypothetical protein A8C32_13680 [Flavivirga aquatica]
MKYLIPKILNHTITDNEVKELQKWLEDSQNKITLENYIRDNYDINLSQSKTNINEAFELVIERIEAANTPIKRIPIYKRSVYKYAAAILIFLCCSIYFLTTNNQKNIETPSVVKTNIIETGTSRAILTLDNGIDIALESGKNYINGNATSNGESLVYLNGNDSKTEITYNYITIPRGGEYYVQLSDGTKVWLNSESKLKYPTNFVKGKVRQVELLHGEAYFEVSPSIKNNGDKFSVLHNLQEIEVLGTKFNIRAYNDETNILTTLVEGKVKVSTKVNSKILKPNEQSIVHSKTKDISILEANVKQEIAWVKGDFIFNKLPLKTIMKTLERWYDVNVVFENKKLENEKFIGELSKYQSLEEILNLIKQTEIIKDYEITDKTIIIN